MDRRKFWKGMVLSFLVVSCSTAAYASPQQTTIGTDDFVMEEKSTDEVSQQEKTEEDLPGGDMQEEDRDMVGTLHIDDKNIYKNMDKAYQDGYVPKIEENMAYIVLPLCFDEDSMETESVAATLKLGEPDGSPFIYKNYQKTFSKKSHPETGKGLFLIQFKLKLQKNRKSGVYPVTVQVDYTANKTEVSQEFVIYVQITNEVEETKEPSSEEKTVEIPGSEETNSNMDEESESFTEEEQQAPEPKVILYQCKDFPTEIHSGEEVSFTAVLKNTNKQKYVQNMVISLNCESEEISIADGSNVVYVDEIGAEGMQELPMKLQVSDNAPSGKYVITLDISYNGPDAESLSSTGRIELHVTQKVNVELEVGTLSSEVNAGDTVKIPVQVMNLGRGGIYNVRCSLDVPGLSLEKSLFLGDMEGGNAVSGEISAFAGVVNEEAEDAGERYGKTSGIVTVYYETEDGKEYTQSQDFSVTIESMQIRSLPDKKDEEKEKKNVRMQMAVGVGILGIISGFGTAASVFVRKRRKGSFYEI